MCDSLVKAQLSTFASVAEKNKIVSLADNCWFLASFNCWNNHCLGSSDYIFFGFLLSKGVVLLGNDRGIFFLNQTEGKEKRERAAVGVISSFVGGLLSFIGSRE